MLVDVERFGSAMYLCFCAFILTCSSENASIEPFIIMLMENSLDCDEIISDRKRNYVNYNVTMDKYLLHVDTDTVTIVDSSNILTDN